MDVKLWIVILNVIPVCLINGAFPLEFRRRFASIHTVSVDGSLEKSRTTLKILKKFYYMFQLTIENCIFILNGGLYLKQETKGIRKWPINWCTNFFGEV